MKPRHAAALALVGWYLMTPPATSIEMVSAPDFTTRWKTSDHTPPPLRNWAINDSFDRAADCSKAKQQLMTSAFKSTDLAPVSRAVWASAECVATDDPRLAK
jgi:hypothetical protein